MFNWRLFLMFTPMLAVAVEPTPVTEANRAIIAYYSPNAQGQSAYEQDTQRVVQQAQTYLKQRVQAAAPAQRAKMAVVFDIDDTLLWRYPYKKSIGFGYDPASFEQHQVDSIDPLVPHIKALYDEAKAYHVAIFIITSGCQHVIAKESANLQANGISGWQAIYAKPDAVCHDPRLTSQAFKEAKRQAITQQGYDIVLTIGDQNTDLGPYADHSFKLPNPMYQVA